MTSHNLVSFGDGAVKLACVYSSQVRVLEAASVVMVTSRSPVSNLCLGLADDPHKLTAAGIKSLQAIGDCDVPGTIAAAVHDGHRAARELDAPPENPDLPFRREEVALGATV